MFWWTNNILLKSYDKTYYDLAVILLLKNPHWFLLGVEVSYFYPSERYYVILAPPPLLPLWLFLMWCSKLPFILSMLPLKFSKFPLIFSKFPLNPSILPFAFLSCYYQFLLKFEDTFLLNIASFLFDLALTCSCAGSLIEVPSYVAVRMLVGLALRRGSDYSKGAVFTLAYLLLDTTSAYNYSF